MIEAVLFDLDGTLVDTNELIIASFRHTYEKHLNIKVSEEEICQYFGEPLVKTLARYDEVNVDKLLATYREFNSKHHDEMTKGIRGAEETLKLLKKLQIKTGVVTSKRREMTLRGLELAGIDNTFDVIITPEDTLKHKPDPEPLLKACDFLNLSPMNVLYVGDTSYDIICGKKAGSKSCLVKYTALPLNELAKLNPDYMIDNLIDILDIVGKENESNKIAGDVKYE